MINVDWFGYEPFVCRTFMLGEQSCGFETSARTQCPDRTLNALVDRVMRYAQLERDFLGISARQNFAQANTLRLRYSDEIPFHWPELTLLNHRWPA